MIGRTQIMRLLKYKNALKRMKNFGFIKAYSNNLGDAIGITSVQVRKDFSSFSIYGSKKGGYNIDDLLEQINKILGKKISNKVVLIGYGKIGKALIDYRGFKNESIEIIAAFDHNSQKINKEAKIPVLPIEELQDYIVDNNIEIAILTVPDLEAQRMFDVLCNSGIKGVLNFAPIKLTETSNCIIHDVNIAAEIEALFYFASDIKLDSLK